MKLKKYKIRFWTDIEVKANNKDEAEIKAEELFNDLIHNAGDMDRKFIKKELKL